jgi:F0F1-type ATP synthase membrane subunit b/b'
LLADIARAMHEAARRERERIGARMAESADAQIDGARLRAAAEARHLKRRAEEDVEDVYERCHALISRIRRDADAEITQRRQRLADALVAHGSILESEVEHVRATIDNYEASLDGFFDRLSAELDPAEIARMAGNLPPAPDLPAAMADARADAVTRLSSREGAPKTNDPEDLGSDPVGVMDPDLVDGGVSGASPTR